jgi:hypothetical protein
MKMRMSRRRRMRDMRVRKMLMWIVVRQTGKEKSANVNETLNGKENASSSFLSLRTLRIGARQAGNMGYHRRRLLQGLFGSWRMISRIIRGMFSFVLSCSFVGMLVGGFID